MTKSKDNEIGHVIGIMATVVIVMIIIVVMAFYATSS